MNIKIGQSACTKRRILEKDVYEFANLVGDFNSVHINQIEAQKSMFGARIVHGMLVGSLISSVLGMKLPGDGTVYLEQIFKFKKAVYFGDTVTVIVTVSEVINETKGIYKLDTVIRNQEDEIVMDGYAVVMYKGE